VPERAVHALAPGRDARRAAGREAQLQARAPRSGLDRLDGRRVGLVVAVMAEEQLAQGLAQRDGARQIRARGRLGAVEQVALGEPRRQRLGRGQLLDVVLEVDGVHERPHQLEASRRLLAHEVVTSSVPWSVVPNEDYQNCLTGYVTGHILMTVTRRRSRTCFPHPHGAWPAGTWNGAAASPTTRPSGAHAPPRPTPR
jgi:hypothetical protein